MADVITNEPDEIEVHYATGNGYFCQCCREIIQDFMWDTCYDNIIPALTELLIEYDYDVEIQGVVIDGDDTSDEADEMLVKLQKWLKEALDADSEVRKKDMQDKRIENMKKNIIRLEKWFAHRDQEVIDKTKELSTARERLIELKK